MEHIAFYILLFIIMLVFIQLLPVLIPVCIVLYIVSLVIGYTRRKAIHHNETATRSPKQGAIDADYTEREDDSQ